MIYDSPSAITPLFAETGHNELYKLALELIKVSSKLSGVLNPDARSAMALLVEPMNSYYSNLIEGHFTNPLEIEKALKNNYSENPAKRMLQLEAKAHVRINKLLKKKIKEIPLVSTEFISWLHYEFYQDLPKELRIITNSKGETLDLIPGQFRTTEVQVGRHIAPAAKILDGCMKLFTDNYDARNITDPLKRTIAIAASHHRLAWIHPFLDGNGRIIRLFSEAYFINENLHSDGIWSISRGLAVYKNEYYASLSNADEQRLNDYDGRGNLSERRLKEFCEFFLKTAIDQVNFMTGLFEVENIIDRINRYVDLMSSRKLLRTESRFVIIEALLRGKINKSEIERITGRSEVTARGIVNDLIEAGLLITEPDNLRAPLRINFPMKVAPYLFPKLFPKDIEATLIE